MNKIIKDMEMDVLITWIATKADVLFSGLGVYVIELLITGIGLLLAFLFFRKKSATNQVTISNVNAGGDVVGRDKKGK